MNIYKCFRTGASQSKHNMCGSRNFYQGGGSRPEGKKTALTAFFIFFVCVVLNLLTEGFQWFYFREGLSFSRGVQLFPGTWVGGGGGPNVNFYRNPYITCDFLSPPLDPNMHNNLYSSCSSLLKRHKICNRQYWFVLLASWELSACI